MLKRFRSLLCLLLLLSQWSFSANADCHDFLDFSAQKLRSKEVVDFCEAFKGKALLVVNTASQCGFTSQFSQLQELHDNFAEKVAIIGFPSNDFKQEYDDSERVAEICYKNFGVTFTMLEPSSVKGESANKMFQRLSRATGYSPSWNFNKYLVSADGNHVTHFPSNIIGEPLIAAIDEVLGLD
ncbi:glutathione peroxidase [Arenicella sp. 4NH20-0111]|uniref:glutathione peroxidase n=1 Tax=Arenicella sp. 4NH20-0111 TaxID=3127648 RepID=UPI0033420100